MAEKETYMALIECPECGRQISDKAGACLGCGYPIGKRDTEAETKKKGFRLNGSSILTLSMGLILLFFKRLSIGRRGIVGFGFIQALISILCILACAFDKKYIKTRTISLVVNIISLLLDLLYIYATYFH